MLKIVIVEDEKKSLEGLKNLLEEFCPDTQVVGTASSVDQGIEQIRQQRPDLVLLDIEMQSATGFDLLEKIGPVDFEVVFTTAYAHYAIKAIKFSALDYLLKPIDIHELQAAVEKVARKLSRSQENNRVDMLLRNLQLPNPKMHKITLSTSEGMVFVPVTDIIRCEASGAYTLFHLKDRKNILVSKNLKEYETLLGDSGFFRVHNSHLINLAEVDRYIKSEGGTVVMKDGSGVAISHTRKDEFLELMKNL